MWEDEDDDDIQQMQRGMEDLFSRAFRSMDSMLFDLESRSLKPLFKIEVDDEKVTVTFDLPGVSKDDVEITSTEETISIEAEMVKPVKLKVSDVNQTRVDFERYSKKIRLPLRVDPNKGTAKFRNGLVVVKLPLIRDEGKVVKIGAGGRAKRIT
jgi:HSP20 family protein